MNEFERKMIQKQKQKNKCKDIKKELEAINQKIHKIDKISRDLNDEKIDKQLFYLESDITELMTYVNNKSK